MTLPVLPHNPREAMQRVLGFLMFDHGCSGAAILHVDHDQPMCEAVRSIRPARMCALMEVWPQALPMLKAGETLAGDDYVLAPLLGQGGLVGALWLDAPAKYTGGLRRWCDGLAHQLVAARRLGPETQPFVLSSRRVALEDSLVDEGWNIARVAKRLGVTRRTVYLWMDKFRIERPR